MSSVNVASVMTRDLGMSREAVNCAFGHGQVFLDDRCLFNTERELPVAEVYGRTLRVGSRSFRPFGSRLDPGAADPSPSLRLVSDLSPETLF